MYYFRRIFLVNWCIIVKISITADEDVKIFNVKSRKRKITGQLSDVGQKLRLTLNRKIISIYYISEVYSQIINKVDSAKFLHIFKLICLVLFEF